LGWMLTGEMPRVVTRVPGCAPGCFADCTRHPGAVHVNRGRNRACIRGSTRTQDPWCTEPELELELIQARMTQKPVLRVEVGARALRLRSVPREEAWASAGAQDAWVSGCGCEAD